MTLIESIIARAKSNRQRIVLPESLEERTLTAADMALAAIIPVIFALFLIMEGANLAIRSFDYRKIGFRMWWMNLALGLLSAVLGFLSFSVPGVGGRTLSLCIGIGLMVVGMVYFVALFAINRFERKLNSNPWVDEQ